MNSIIKKEIKKHVKQNKPITEKSLIVAEIKKEMKKVSLNHSIK